MKAIAQYIAETGARVWLCLNVEFYNGGRR
jgi:hypothetical protein